MDRRSEKESNVYHGPVAVICNLMAAALLPAACAEIPDTCGNTSAAGSGLAGPAACPTELVIGTGDYRTRSSAPDEMQLTDFNIFIFNADGLLEEHVYTDISQMHSNDDGDWTYGFRLLKGCRYAIYVCANTGFRLSCRNLSELLDYRFYMAYPDEYRIGMLMSGTKYLEFLGEEEIRVGLKRAMAKISVGIDRSALDDDVEFNVIRARIGNCPRNVRLFGDSSLDSDNGAFASGYSISDTRIDRLNSNVSGQLSGEVSLYMFENLQGNPLGYIGGYDEKFFEDGDPLERQCSFIELTAEYISDNYYSLPGDGLVYRFYLGESPSDFNVGRNCHYHITVRPEGSGLSGSGWNVDKSGMGYKGPTEMHVTPGNYIRGRIGEKIHIRCDLVPSETPLDLGKEHLDYDRERGIYDYEVDEDGRGVVLTLTGSGRGMIYFEAGAPVNDAELIIIEVDLPTD